MSCLKRKTHHSQIYSKSHVFQLTTFFFLLVFYCFSANAQPDTSLKNTLPSAGKMINDKPAGKGWVNLLSSADDWNFESTYWQLNNNVLHGSIGKEKEHHYSYTKKSYGDFELNVMIKMVGDADANSGVCIRINPTSWDDAPGYQVDMGRGYWGLLWEERRLVWYRNSLIPLFQKL